MENIIIPDDELEIFDVEAKDLVPEGAIDDTIEVGDVEDGSEILVAPTTHDIEEAIPGTLEEDSEVANNEISD